MHGLHLLVLVKVPDSEQGALGVSQDFVERCQEFPNGGIDVRICATQKSIKGVKH